MSGGSSEEVTEGGDDSRHHGKGKTSVSIDDGGNSVIPSLS